MQKQYWFEAVGDLGDFVFGQTSRSQWFLGDAFAVWRVVARSAALADSSSRTIKACVQTDLFVDRSLVGNCGSLSRPRVSEVLASSVKLRERFRENVVSVDIFNGRAPRVHHVKRQMTLGKISATTVA